MSLYVLYLRPMNPNQEEIKVASIVEQMKTVKRKRDVYQGWLDVKPGDSLSPNDEIYTHGQSSAKINFINGPEISLFENSLLRIKTINKSSTLSLDKGNLIAKLDKDSPNLDIELSGKKYSFKSNDANIQIEQGTTENKFLLLQGKAKLKDQEILPNQMVIQDLKTGNIKVKNIPFIPLFPSHNFSQYFLKETSIDFSWRSEEKEKKATLQVSRDSLFKNLLYFEEAASSKLKLSFHESGTYFWRLVSEDGLSGPIKTFTLQEEKPLLITARFTELYQNDKAFLKWPKEKENRFLLKIVFPDRTSKEMVLNKNFYEFPLKDLGSYDVSVKVDSPERPLALWSAPITINTKQIESPQIESFSPEFVEKVVYDEKNATHNLSWDGPSSLSYKVRITRNNQAKEFTTEQTSFVLNLKDAGEFAWQVQGKSQNGALSNILRGTILVKTPLKIAQLPKEGAVIELEKPDQLVSFKWDKVTEASLYQFELSDDALFSTVIVTKDVDTNSISSNLAKTGRYFWRVKIKKGNSVEYSRPVSVEIRPSPPLSRPEVEPSIKIKLKYLEQSSSFHLLDFFIGKAYAESQTAVAEWNLPVNTRAKSYIVEVYRDSELKNLVTRFETTTPHAVWKEALPGTFYWRVSYVDFWDRQTEFSKTSKLEVETIPEFVKPIPLEIALSFPPHRGNILNKDEDSSSFSWEPLPGIKTYELFIASDLDFSRIIFNKKVNAEELKVNCETFKQTEGDYYWKVETKENSSKRRMVHVTCAPKKQEIALPEKKEELPPTTPIVPIKEEKRLLHYAQFGFTPHYLMYKNTAKNYSAKIDGAVLNSWKFQYQRPMDLGLFQTLSPSLSFSRGKVFKNITFTDFDLSLKAAKEEKTFSWGFLIGLSKRTLYVEENLKIVDENDSSPTAGVFYKKYLGTSTVNVEALYSKELLLKADVQFALKDHYYVGAFFDHLSFSKEENDHQRTRMGLTLHYTLNFLK